MNDHPTTQSGSVLIRLKRRTLMLLAIATAVLGLGIDPGFAQPPRVLPPNTLPNDQRLGPLKDLDGYFPFQPCKTPEEWASRAERVRRQVLVAVGLWPMPTKTPLNAVIHGKIDQGSYTVEKVYFESFPGFFVTGSLYRPKSNTGKAPGVLCPHGHWSNGRFHDAGANEARNEIVQGAERFEEGGRSPLQSRCVQLARMGCVVFHYDMIGYADSVQLSFDLAHRFAKQRPEMNSVENWGLYSPQAEAHLQSIMGLQAWSSIRALDFIAGLSDVDPDRIAVTGASGGGTQTFILSAIDPRPAVSFPAVMVSTAMQGGCTCENACLLRIDTGNVEFAALFAPKPLGLTAADDWTKEMPTKGFPELKQHFQMLGAPANVMLKPLLHFGHNYNYVSRAAMYGWLNKHLKLGLAEPVVEEDYKRLSTEQMTVWDDAHPKPEGGPDFERKLLRWLTEDAEKQLLSAQESPARYREIVGGAVDVLIGRNLSNAGKVEFSVSKRIDNSRHIEVRGLLRNTTWNEELPMVVLQPKKAHNDIVIWINKHGKASLYAPHVQSQNAHSAVSGAESVELRLAAPVQKLLDAGVAVIGVDLLYQGEFLEHGEPILKTRRVNNPREFAGYTFGYNHSLFAQRVHDILSVIKYAAAYSSAPPAGNAEPTKTTVSVIGLGGAGRWAAAAVAQANGAVARAAIDTAGFRFGNVLDIQDVDFLPGGAKYGDLPSMIALGALTSPPVSLLLAGKGKHAPDIVIAIYQKASALDELSGFDGDEPEASAAAVEWLLFYCAR